MSCLAPNYNPNPTRVWSRVQNPCTFVDNRNISQVVNYYEEQQMFAKGNILQYKANSSNLTKTQKFSLIAKGKWTNRTTTWSSQTETYTNPNTRNQLRVNSTLIPISTFQASQTCKTICNNTVYKPYLNLPLSKQELDNQVINTFSSNNPCSTGYIEDGGTLIVNKIADPCTKKIIKQTFVPGIICSLSTSSNIPGPAVPLCWNKNIAPWYPKQRYIMTNSGNKWPVNYKGLVSANSL
jgi:hypothetical protein